MIILLEGPDGSGKTYLSNILIEKYKASYIHSTKPKDSNDIHLPSMHSWLAATILSKNGGIVVLDRHFLSQLIYQDLFEDKEHKNQYTSQNYMYSIDKIVICLPEKTKYLENFEKLKNERYELYNNMTNVYDSYYNVAFGIKQNVIKNEQYNHIIEQGGLCKLTDTIIFDRYNTSIEELLKKLDIKE